MSGRMTIVQGFHAGDFATLLNARLTNCHRTELATLAADRVMSIEQLAKHPTIQLASTDELGGHHCKMRLVLRPPGSSRASRQRGPVFYWVRPEVGTNIADARTLLALGPNTLIMFRGVFAIGLLYASTNFGIACDLVFGDGKICAILALCGSCLHLCHIAARDAALRHHGITASRHHGITDLSQSSRVGLVMTTHRQPN